MVSDLNPLYTENIERWDKNRDLYDGEQAVKEKTTTYLPPLGYHSKNTTGGPEAYKTFLQYAVFFDATYRTVSAMTGLVFRKNPFVGPKELTGYYEEHFTVDDQTLPTAAETLVTETLLQGRVGLLVSYPDIDVSDMSKQDFEDANIKAYSAIYKTEDIINWKTEKRNGKIVPVLVVLRESIANPFPSSIFDTDKVIQYRVLELDAENYYKESVYLDSVSEVALEKKLITNGIEGYKYAEKYPLMNGEKLDFIPFYPITPNGVSWDLERSPMNGIVDLNIGHYRNSAVYESALILTASPTTVLSGYQGDRDKPIILGGSNCLLVSDSGSANYLEYKGNGIGSIKDAMEIKKQEMALLGVKILSSDSQANVAASTVTLQQSGEQAVLADIANSVSDAMTEALRVMVKWDDVDDDVSEEELLEVFVKLNTDFVPNSMTANDVNALTVLWKSLGISDKAFFEILKQGEILPADMSFEEHQEEIENSGMAGLQGDPKDPNRDKFSAPVDYRRLTDAKAPGDPNAPPDVPTDQNE